MMNKMILLFLSLMINLLFLNFNNPLIMGLLLLLQTFLVVLMMGKIHYSFWFSYIMFLVFIGGLFILFIYIISLTFNNKFYFMKKFYIFSFSLLIMIFMNYKLITLMNSETSLFSTFYMKENYFYSMKFYNFPNNMINLLMVSYLFMLMVMVVKITNFNFGPIRSLN